MDENNFKLIVNYLPQTLTDEDFRRMFEAVGKVSSAKIVRQRQTGFSYGFGFVEYVNPEDSARAIESLNSSPCQNKNLKVAYSRSSENTKGANLYITNIPKNISDDELQSLFQPYGHIINARILKDKSANSSKGVGFVLFESQDQANAAIDALDGQHVPGYTSNGTLSVKHSDDNRGKPRPPPGSLPSFGRPSYPPYNFYDAYDGYRENGYGNYGPMRNISAVGRHRFNPTGYGAPPPSSGLSAIPQDGHILFVYNIGPHADEKILFELFSPFGAIIRVNVIVDPETQQGKGYGFVTMRNYQEAAHAIQALNGYQPRSDMKPLQVSFKTPK